MLTRGPHRVDVDGLQPTTHGAELSEPIDGTANARRASAPT
jgi:hypothetical protein